MSIKTKLILVVICVLIVAGFSMWLVVYKQNNQKLSAYAQTHIEDTVNYTDQLVNFYLGRVEENITNLANDHVILEALETKNPSKLAQASEKMTIVNEAISPIEGIGLHEIKGSTCTNVAADKLSLSVVGRDFSDRDYCKGILAAKSSYISSAYISAITNHIILGIVSPVKNIRGEMIGYVLGTINMDELRSYLVDLQHDSATYLLDRYGTLFVNTKEDLATLDAYPSPQDSIVGEVQMNLSKHNKQGYFLHDDYLVAYKNGVPVTIVYEKSNTDLFSLINTLNVDFFFALLITVALTILLIYLFIGTITGRIARVSRVTRKIAEGQFDITLDKKDLASKDEVGVLARAFNNMAINLADMYKGLEEKVKQRTLEVEETNKELQISAAELTKALELSERTTHAMVGRELEMKKLKEKIKECENKHN